MLSQKSVNMSDYYDNSRLYLMKSFMFSCRKSIIIDVKILFNDVWIIIVLLLIINNY